MILEGVATPGEEIEDVKDDGGILTGEIEVKGVGVLDIGVRRSNDDNIEDQLGLNKEVSNEVSSPSCNARDRTDDDGPNCEDS